jgi:hypothetical protein
MTTDTEITDQYGNPVPFDELAWLQSPSTLSDDEIEQCLEADWYRVNGELCAPYSQLPDCVETPIEVTDKSDVSTVEYIARSLHRVDERMGFYHA